MRRRVVSFAVWFVAFCLASTASIAQEELFVPLTGSEEVSVRAENDYALHKQSYFSKRYRLVRINPDLVGSRLDASQYVVASFFDDVRLTYNIRSVDRSQAEEKLRVFAVFVDGEITGSENSGDQKGKEQGGAPVIENLFGLTLLGRNFVHDSKRGRFWAVSDFRFPPDSRPGSRREARAIPSSHPTVMAFTADVSDPYSSAEYRLEWLESNPNYHIIWEVDTSKTLIRPMDETDALTVEQRAESDRRERAFDDFRRALGPDPRKASEQDDFHAYLDSLEKKPNRNVVRTEEVQ